MRYGRSSYKLWLKRFFAVFLSFLIVVAVFNFIADGGGIFRPNAGLGKEAEDLLSGRMVAGYFSVFDERELQRLIIARYAVRRDIVIVGSSRAMSVRRRFIQGNPDLFNHSMSGAGLEDMVSIIGLYLRKDALPKMVIFAIDPWIFNKNNGLRKRSEALRVSFREMMREIEGAAAENLSAGSETRSAKNVDRMARYKELISIDYTVQNWKSLRGGKGLNVVDTADIDDYVREPDGSVHFPYNMRHLEMIENGGKKAMPDSYFNQYTLYGKEILEGLVSYLQRQGVRVVLLLPPLEPSVYLSCVENPKYAITLRIEEYLRDLARRKSITVVGSYDPSPYGFRGEDFFDGHHGYENVMQRLFEGFE